MANCIYFSLQTVEFIPNPLHDEWTKAWNDVQRIRDAVGTDNERDMVIKWVMWLPRKGSRGKRFVMWRQKDMTGLTKVCKGAVVAAERRMSKAKARKERADILRIERAITLLRHGAISRA